MKFALLQRHAVKVAAGLFLLSGILFVNPTDSLAASKVQRYRHVLLIW